MSATSHIADAGSDRTRSAARARLRHDRGHRNHPRATLPRTSPEPLAALLAATATELGPDELGVLTLVAERLLEGRRRYGNLRLATDRRNFAREALEEALDLSLYAAAGLLRPGITGKGDPHGRHGKSHTARQRHARR